MGRLALGLALVALGCTTNSIELDSGADLEPMDDSSGSGSSPGSTSSVTAGPATSPTTSPPPDPDPPPPSTTGMTTSPPMPTTAIPDTGDADSGQVEVSFFADVAPILQGTCAPVCHEPGGLWEVQDLLNSPYFALVGVPATQNPDMNKVEPGEPELSYMFHKILGTHVEVGGSGAMMPLEQRPLSPQQIQTIQAWILAGAPNN